MQLINKKNYWQTVCILYTIIALFKSISEGINGFVDQGYSRNYIVIFPIVALSVFVLSLHYYLQNIPVVLVIIGQYLVLLGIILGSIWISSFFSEVAEHGYWDMFLSFTIPYVVLVPVYYIQFFMQIKKANRILPELTEDENGK